MGTKGKKKKTGRGERDNRGNKISVRDKTFQIVNKHERANVSVVKVTCPTGQISLETFQRQSVTKATAILA